MKFLCGLLIGGIVCAFCAVAFLPANVIDNIRSWTNQQQIEVVQPDNEQDGEQDNNVVDVPNLGNDNIEM